MIELMSDWEGNFHSNLRARFLFKKDRFTFEPYAELKLKTKKYNSYYIGLTLEDIKGGTDITAGFVADFHLWSSLYLFGAAKITHLDRNVRKTRLINNSFTSEVFFGVGLSDDRNKRSNRSLRNRPYWRVAHGRATPSALAQIIRFQSEPDSFNNQLTSIFYGHPLTDELFGLPLDIYLTPGFIWHWKSSVQDHSQEVVLRSNCSIP
jgi:outer membrane protein